MTEQVEAFEALTEDDPEASDRETRALVQRGLRALDGVRAAFAALGATDEAVGALLAKVEVELNARRPPEPRRCKEYLRSVAREKKGLIGISPEDVALYCRCPECSGIRDRLGVELGAGRPPAPESTPAATSADA